MYNLVGKTDKKPNGYTTAGSNKRSEVKQTRVGKGIGDERIESVYEEKQCA